MHKIYAMYVIDWGNQTVYGSNNVEDVMRLCEENNLEAVSIFHRTGGRLQTPNGEDEVIEEITFGGDGEDEDEEEEA